jgi:hypothetical protein
LICAQGKDFSAFLTQVEDDVRHRRTRHAGAKDLALAVIAQSETVSRF